MDDHAPERRALAVLRIVLGLMLLSTFFENLSKGAYTPAGYKGVIEFYLKNGHAPAAWKAIESLAASNSRVAGPMQAVAELGMGVLAGAFLFTLWLSELGAAWPWELAMYVVVAFAVAYARAGRTWGVDAVLARRIPSWRLG